MQRLDVARKPPLGLELQEAADIRLRQVGHFDMRRERPLQRETHNALALPDSSGIEVVPNFPAHQLGVIG